MDVNKGRVRHGKAPEPYTRGAVIAIDPRTNEVLALVSSPTYDPNWFSRVPSPDPKAKTWAIDPNRPLAKLDAVTTNRVVQAYSPGSVFKLATTLLQEEQWGNFTRSCDPVYRFGQAVWKNWASYSLGPVDGRLAISYSCNPWYYDSAVRAGPERYARTLVQRMRELGYLRPTGVELVGEKLGTMRSPEDYTSLEDKWYPGFAINMSIGQGSVQVTPAQVAWVMSTIVNDGQQRPLTVVKAVGGVPQRRKPATSVVQNGNTGVFAFVKEGMAGTTAGTQYGTAKHEIGPDRFPVRTGGKTGTAENGTSYHNGLAYKHAWYEGYGPIGKDGPANFAVVTFFQNGGEGSGPALRAAKRMFAARWCVTLDDQGSALPLATQQPCTGELDQLHRAQHERRQRLAGQRSPW